MKNLAVIGIIGGIFWWASQKAQEIGGNFLESAKQIQFKIAGIKNVKWVGGLPFLGNNPRIKFNLDLELVNPTNTDFTLDNQNVVQLSRLEFLDNNGQIMATSLPNINGLNLPSQSSAKFKNIPTEIPVNKLDNVFQQFSSNLNPSDLNIRVSVIVAGTEYTLK